LSAESLTIEVRCARNGRVMRVGFGRLSPEYAFEVEAVLPGSGVSTSIGGARLAAGHGQKRDKQIDVDTTSRRRDAMEFDWSMFRCIHCEGASSSALVIECGACGTLICGGTVRKLRGDRFSFSCGVCGAKSSGKFSGPIESFAARPGHAAPPALPDGKRGLLDHARNLLPRGKKDS
jgi:hypothetical protein